MRISSWNVNSVRARLENVLDYLKKQKPDILMLQEIKAQEINFPSESFKKIGYKSHIFGQKSYNGVAFLSKVDISNVSKKFINDPLSQARIIYGTISLKKKEIILINIYVPNGNPVESEKYDYKKKWLNDLLKQLKILLKKNPNVIIGGDFNIIPSAEDVYNPKSFEDDALFRLEIRKKLREILNLGFHDVYRHFNENKEGYTFWDYMRGAWQKNNGMRIDHFLVSNSLIDQIKSININKDPRGREKPSDHTPIEIKLT